MVTHNEDGTYTIEKEGQRPINTKNYKQLSEDQYTYLLSRFKSKPDFEKVVYDINGIEMGQLVYPNINNYYFFDLQAKVLLKHNRFTIEQVFNDIELLSIFYGKISINDSFFTSDDMYDNILAAMRTAGRPYCSKPSNFPIDVVDDILKKYNVNNNYYDPSCGWGDRLLSSIRNNVNYYGTDPNYLLCDRLNNLVNDYKSATLKNMPHIEINCQGSEIFIPKYHNSMGLAFTSPPYFDLEDYGVGDQSFKEGTSYDMWLNGFMKDTMINCYDYLIDDGYYGINIKNFDNLTLEEDCVRLAEEIGFKLFCVEELHNISRVAGASNRQVKKLLNTNERIYMFKKDSTNLRKYHMISNDTETVVQFAQKIYKVKKKKLF